MLTPVLKDHSEKPHPQYVSPRFYVGLVVCTSTGRRARRCGLYGDGLASPGCCRLAFRRSLRLGGLRGGGLGVAVKGSDLVFGICLYWGTRALTVVALTEGFRVPDVLFFLFFEAFEDFEHFGGGAFGGLVFACVAVVYDLASVGGLARGDDVLAKELAFDLVDHFGVIETSLFFLFILFGRTDGAAMGESFLFEAEAGGPMVGAAQRDEIAADARHGSQLVGWGTLLQGDEKGPGHEEIARGEPWDGLVGE